MKNIKFIYLKITLLLGFIFTLTVSCEREYSDDVEFASHNASGEIYTDAPVGLTDEFFISFDPATGANTQGFGTDNDEAYQGSSSIRIDVPTPSDPDGGYIGGIFKDRGAGRDLTSYDALTFWAKGSTTATIGTVGFGTDFEGNEYAVTLENVELSTDWRKIIIPIPDPSKLVQEKGMFLFSAGTQSTNGTGYTFWLDEMRFE
ncbi:MAG: carbohydrate-binding protein, partial [Bacteroidetes bacterium]|nr:carbohydrate-binding protein [Bacteroidota bacterium]